MHPGWSDSEEEEKDLNKQNREGEEKQEIEDQDGVLQNQKELKLINIKIPESDPKTMSPLETEDTTVCTPQLTDTLVGKTREIPEKEEQKGNLHDSDNAESFEDDSDDTIDNIV